MVFVILSLRIDTLVFYFPYVKDGYITLWNILAGGVFILAALTDLLDGYIARRSKLVTSAGKFIDSLADKLLIIIVIVALLGLRLIPVWASALIITREFLLARLRHVGSINGISTPVSYGGKLTTVFQTTALGFLIFKMPGGTVLIWLATLLTTWTGITAAVPLCKQLSEKWKKDIVGNG